MLQPSYVGRTCISNRNTLWRWPKAVPHKRSLRSSGANNSSTTQETASSGTCRRRTALALSVVVPSLLGTSGAHAYVPPLPVARPCPLPQQGVLERGYAGPGPLTALNLPRLEHTCISCFPACVGDKCLVSIDVTYPKGGVALFQGKLGPPYPLVVWCGGFTVGASSYASTASRLASWGYTVLRYNTREALTELLDDITHVQLLREMIDWAATHPLVRQLADVRQGVILAGHSRGAKLATLTAVRDSRVVGLGLIDPVDVTQYAPESPRYPSATSALAAFVCGRSSSSSSNSSSLFSSSQRFLPVAIVGGSLGGACAPAESNYNTYFNAARWAWEVEVRGAGHFAVLDDATALQRVVCAQSEPNVADASVRTLSQGVLLSLCEAVMRPGGRDVLSMLGHRCAIPQEEPPTREGGSYGGGYGDGGVGFSRQAGQGAAGSSNRQHPPRGSAAASTLTPPTWATQRQPPPVYLPPGPLPPPTLQPDEAGTALRSSLERAITQLQYQCKVQQGGGLLELSVRFKGFGSTWEAGKQ